MGMKKHSPLFFLISRSDLSYKYFDYVFLAYSLIKLSAFSLFTKFFIT